MDSRRTEIETKYTSVNDFETNFDVEKELFTQFIEYAKNNEVLPNEEQINISKPIILNRLKALVARNIWGTSAYYQISSNFNNSYIKAIEEINNDTFKKEKLVYN